MKGNITTEIENTSDVFIIQMKNYTTQMKSYRMLMKIYTIQMKSYIK